MKIKTYEDGSARLLWDWRDIALITADFEAAREFFQAERDEQLGRWRDPENPDMVCYPVAGDLDAVWVMYEGAGSRYYVTRTGWELTRPQYASETAGRYFQAHPEPKPWHGAEGREVWEITVNGEELLCRSNSDGDFTPVFGHHHWATISNGSREITAGRRIWPEEDK